MTWDADDQLNTWWPWAQDVVTWWLLNALRFWVKIDMNCSCSHPFFSSVCTCIYIYIYMFIVYILYFYICLYIHVYYVSLYLCIYIYVFTMHSSKKWWRHGIMGNGPTKNGTGDPKAHGPLSDIGWCTTAFIRYNYSILFHLVQLPSPKATVGPWK